MRTARRRQAFVAVLGLLAALAVAPAAEAKGPPTRVRITGPDVPGAIEIQDARLLDAFAPGTLEGGTPLAPAPGPEAARSYLITRYYGPELFDQVHYVPNPEGSGRLFADGIVYQRFVMRGVEWEPHAPGVVGHWWTLRPETEQMLQHLVASPPAAPESQEADRPSFNVLPWLPLLDVLLAGLLLGRAASRRLSRASAHPGSDPFRQQHPAPRRVR
jgi:hypothetical protein